MDEETRRNVEYTAIREIGWMSATDEHPVEEDRLILKRIAEGDRQALAELYLRHQRSLFNYLLQLTSDHGMAEEILQDTLVAVWKSAHTFENRSTLLTWLIGIARRQAHNTLRQRKLPQLHEAKLERSEEHTSELQSRQYLVCRLLLEKKKQTMLRTDILANRDA